MTDASPAAADVLEMLLRATPSQRARILDRHPEAVDRVREIAEGKLADESPLGLARVLNPLHRALPHLDYLDNRLSQAVADVENGKSRFIRISMPPRSGKSVSTSEYLPLWILRRHPEWKIALISHSPNLATSWGRQIRRMVEQGALGEDIQVASDAGAVTDWETTKRGGVSARSGGQSITGRGFKVMILDDLVKDYADAASETKRETLQDWWQTTARTRLEPPSLCIVIGTRWHEDDFTGWVSTTSDPFEDIVFPAIAEEDDILGREEGDPLYSPFIVETREEALARWADLKAALGAYAWSALYQQSPSPAKGSVFNTDDFRYWTTDPEQASRDSTGDLDPNGRTILLPQSAIAGGYWLDSWDLAMKGSKHNDYVVGQRWVRAGLQRFLIAQQRGQWEFPEQVKKFQDWERGDDPIGSPYGHLVYKRVVEDAANGPALIATLKDKIGGIDPVKARGSKEERARAITPEIEAGYVFLPSPQMEGFDWVTKLIDELRNFPKGKHDDQVDSLSQGLLKLRPAGSSSLTVPGGRPLGAAKSRSEAARTMRPRVGQPGTTSPFGRRIR